MKELIDATIQRPRLSYRASMIEFSMSIHHSLNNRTRTLYSVILSYCILTVYKAVTIRILAVAASNQSLICIESTGSTFL